MPLSRGSAYCRFRIQLGDHYLVIRLRWLTLYGYFCVDIHEQGQPVACGRALHPGVDLLAGLNNNLGKLVLRGATPTISNLGVDNKLEWIPNE
ncbi:hypothetical protein FH968_01920 [Buttiauxella sp. B2]|nr:hypothetical protein FH968_01920 [Buttiauxella sp. B2]